jgi:hypothetical protein
VVYLISSSLPSIEAGQRSSSKITASCAPRYVVDMCVMVTIQDFGEHVPLQQQNIQSDLASILGLSKSFSNVLWPFVMQQEPKHLH